ncbi:MAG: tryptophan synthase subunit alpha [Verrucomicrobiae bacterium]|nr:tryptophan synthase subunit alpha [Verrucomicrobiae bacterium]
MNRIDRHFTALRKTGKKAFVAYITAGDHSLDVTASLVREFEKSGVDAVELGVPFSDPLADGAVNQSAADRALRSGTSLAGILRTVEKLRREGAQIPLILFTYFNPIHRYGLKRFVTDAAKAGVDGVLYLDLPPEESGECLDLMESAGLHAIHLVSPTTPDARLARIVRRARGFIYYVSREGVTGMQSKLQGGIAANVARIRRCTKLPLVIGFGISTPAQVKSAASFADGCVVGSVIVKRIGELQGKPGLARQVAALVRRLAAPLKTIS